MKFLSIIKKNFMLLMRSKSSAFILLAGPVVIILIVSLFFSGKSTYDLSVGYYAPNPNDMTQGFVKALEDNEFVVYPFTNESACIDKIKKGMIQTCIIFPENFEVKNAKSTELRFIVDYSRINLVYKVIDSVSEIIDVESNEVSQSLTNVLLSRIDAAIEDLRDHERSVSQISDHKKNLSNEIAAIKLEIENMDFESKDLLLASFEKDIENANTSMEEYFQKADELYAFAEETLDDLDGPLDENESDELWAELHDINASLFEMENKTYYNLLELIEDFSNLEEDLSDFFTSIERNRQISELVDNKLDSMNKMLSALQSYTNSLVAEAKSTRTSLEAIDITKAETIVSPIDTRIEPLIAESSTFQFAFPFLLVLMMMFASLMISSTLVIFEKNSRALFRNFATPIHKNAFTLAHFVTVLLIVMAQSLIILLFSYTSLKFSLFSNLFSVLVALLVSITFFTVLGLIIGSIFSSQEGAVMASLVIGAMFLFVSNLVVPLESFAPELSNIIKYNPFIIFSELLRQSLLFGTPFMELVRMLGFLLLISFGIFGLLFFVFGFSRKPGGFKFNPFKAYYLSKRRK
ncbi:ABC transporter permease [Candidatus Woesearchaeota archaeon]|nr:ABC transporter permease [Candidatus Woesearchaeota archaeon]